MTASMTLSIVHFSTADGEGGSARSAHRIHSHLRDRGHQSRMLVKYRVLEDPDVDTVSGSGRLLGLADRLAEGVTWRLGLQYQVVPSSRRLLRHAWLQAPDIIQLYNTHGGYFAHRLLPALSRRAPIIWRLSDMWPVTGHCAYAGSCDRWQRGCGQCPDLATYPMIGLDTTAFLWRQKLRLYRKTRLTVVAPSSWIAGVVKASPLLADAAVHRIPNGLDLSVFRPLDRKAAREFLGVPQEQKVILFAPHWASRNPRKGTDLLEAAMRSLGPRDDVVLLLAGVGGQQWIGKVPQRVIALGYLRDDRLIAMANAAADCVVVPSSVENLPNGVIEAFACGRPVVAFDAGGIRDAVRTGENGILVPAGDADAFAKAIDRLLGDDELRERCAHNALDTALREYSAELEATRFEKLYDDVLTRHDGPASRDN
jgi:glycosyltransferase involved in cell wall biosynthesis